VPDEDELPLDAGDDDGEVPSFRAHAVVAASINEQRQGLGHVAPPARGAATAMPSAPSGRERQSYAGDDWHGECRRARDAV
jgi:hypothetical protein